jgi:hypothetical protein
MSDCVLSPRQECSGDFCRWYLPDESLGCLWAGFHRTTGKERRARAAAAGRRKEEAASADRRRAARVSFLRQVGGAP